MENVGYGVVVCVWPVRTVAFAKADVGRCRCYVAEFARWVLPPAWHPFVKEVSRWSPVPEFAGDVECRNGCEFGVWCGLKNVLDVLDPLLRAFVVGWEPDGGGEC